MRRDEAIELISAIADPNRTAVLFLGQQYMSSLTGEDAFMEQVREQLAPQSARFTDYGAMWEAVGKGRPLTTEQFRQMHDCMRDVPEQPWLRWTLSQPWNMVFTSAIDNCMDRCVGDNMKMIPIPLEERQRICFKPQYGYKHTRYCCHLYGTLDGNSRDDVETDRDAKLNPLPPADAYDRQNTRLKLDYDATANDHLRWIYEDLVGRYHYGILVIDGWDPESDWAEDLLRGAWSEIENEKSVYIFGATREMQRNRDIKRLVDSGKAVLIEERFAAVMQEYYEFEENGDDEQFDYAFAGKTVSIQSPSGIKFLQFSNDVLRGLEMAVGPQIQLIYDDYAQPETVTEENREVKFAQFLQQRTELSQWSLSPSFYQERDYDQKLKSKVLALAGRDPYKERPVILLEGPSNSGKSASLIHLALELRKERKFPVLFINGNPSENWFVELRTWLQRNLQGARDKDNNLINVVVIWDGGNNVSRKQYQELARTLMSCQPIVVGSRYESSPRNSGGDKYEAIAVSQTLSDNERRSFINKLKATNRDLARLFAESYQEETDTSFLAVLQRISNYRNTAEWNDVEAFLSRRFQKEASFVEDDLTAFAEESLDETMNELKRIAQVQKEVSSAGMGSAFQLQLKALLEDMTDEQENEEHDEIELRVQARDMVVHLNQLLAVAGEFVGRQPIPEELLLRILFESLEKSLSNEQRYALMGFLRELLANDLLAQREGGLVQFRHIADAEKYAECNFGENREEQEVKFLLEFIEHCDWNNLEEAKTVNLLVKCFGTNSAGRYRKERGRSRIYWDYYDYQIAIADHLETYAYRNPYAMVTNAHFVREPFLQRQDHGELSAEVKDYTNEQICARLQSACERLEALLDDTITQNDGQLNNVIRGEICANKQAQLHFLPRITVDYFEGFKRAFDETLLEWDYERGASMDFRVINLLDVWMNAVTAYHDSFEGETALDDKNFRRLALYPSLSYIDMLFDPEDELFESEGKQAKIYKIFRWAKESTGKGDYAETRKRMLEAGNDTPLYLECMQNWYRLDADDRREEEAEKRLLAPKDTDSLRYWTDDALEKSPMEIYREIAEKNLKLLEQYPYVVENSARCLCVKLRCQWILFNGDMPLAEGQKVRMTKAQWNRIGLLCEQYRAALAENQRPHAMVAFLQVVYSYLYGGREGRQQAENWFNRDRYIKRNGGALLSGNEWIIKRIGLCYPDDDPQNEPKLRVFKARYTPKPNTRDGSYYGEILEERDEVADVSLPNVVGARRIYISANDVREENRPQGDTMYGTLWFNAQGPVLTRLSADRGGNS